MFPGKVFFVWRCASRALAVLALIVVLFSLWTVDSRGAETGRKSSRSHKIGLAIALYHNRFLDDVISPVVYTSSSPLYECFYRNVNDVNRHTCSLKLAFYTAGMRDDVAGDNFELFYSDGDVYTYPRSLHQLDGSRVELEYDYLRRIFTFEQGKSAFHLGGSVGFYTEEISGIDRWSSELEWRKVKTWLADFSLALEGKLERRLREYDRLSFDLHLTVISCVSRAPYYYPVTSSDNMDPSKVKYSGMFPNDFLRWSAQLSYELWLKESFGLEVYYRFQHQRAMEPRNLRYVSHTLSLGVIYATD